MFSVLSAYLVPLAQAPGGQGPGGLLGSPIIPLVLFLVIMYFLLIRPQNKKMKDHRELLNRLKAGDEIVTSGGIHGTITGVKENELQVRIAENVEITLARAAVSRLREEENEVSGAPAQKGAKK
ncbi:MAG: preprotein translocase subunit YajC [Verrucomicrobiota bacterium]